MSYQQKLSGLKCWDSFRDLTLQKMEIIPFAITECPDLCSCQICKKKQPEKEEPQEQNKKSQKIMKQPRQRRFSICGFKDDLLTICQMLQKQDEVVRPININILDTIILKEREFVLYAFYDNGFRYIKNKSFFHTDMEKQLLDRKIEFEVNHQIKQIKSGIHPTIKLSELYENSNQVTTKLKQQITDLLNAQSILMARYQTGETTLIGKFELHQLSVLSKTNVIFDNLLHLQLYLYNEKTALDFIETNKRNSKDYFIHRYKYIKDNSLFSDIVCEQSYLTDPSLRGQRLWNKEKEYSDNLDLKEYFKYTCHKIAVYIQSFHKQCINEMEVHFIVIQLKNIQDYPKNITIINVIGLKMSKAEETQWVIKTGRVLSTAEKIQINDVDLNENNKPQTQRSLVVSQSLIPSTQKVIEKIKPITAQVIVNNMQSTRTQDAFKTLNPQTNESINQILENQNFPKQLKRYQSMQRDSPIKSRIDDQPLTCSRDVQIDDYLLKSRQKKKKQTINSPFLRSISRRFFTRRNSADFC